MKVNQRLLPKVLSCIGKTGEQLTGTQGTVQCTPSFYRVRPPVLPVGRELGCGRSPERGTPFSGPPSGHCIQEQWVGWRLPAQPLCCLLDPLDHALSQDCSRRLKINHLFFERETTEFLEGVSKLCWRNQHNSRMKRCQAMLGMPPHRLFLTRFHPARNREQEIRKGCILQLGVSCLGISGTAQEDNIHRRTMWCRGRHFGQSQKFLGTSSSYNTDSQNDAGQERRGAKSSFLRGSKSFAIPVSAHLLIKRGNIFKAKGMLKP